MHREHCHFTQCAQCQMLMMLVTVTFLLCNVKSPAAPHPTPLHNGHFTFLILIVDLFSSYLRELIPFNLCWTIFCIKLPIMDFSQFKNIFRSQILVLLLYFTFLIPSFHFYVMDACMDVFAYVVLSGLKTIVYAKPFQTLNVIMGCTHKLLLT